MAETDTALNLSKHSQTKVCQFIKDAHTMWGGANSSRTYMEWMDRQYARRLDSTSSTLKAQAAAFAHDPTKFRNIIYPIIMPQVEAAVTYQTEVFCTGVPLFPVVTPPMYAEAGEMLETLIDQQATRGGWASELSVAFRDAFKYNLCALETSWQVEMVPLAGGTRKSDSAVRWQGNKVRRLDLYNTFYDTRVQPSKVSKDGDFAGTVELMTRTRLRRMLSTLPTKLAQNEAAAMMSSQGGAFGKKFVVPDIGTTMFRGAITQSYDWRGHFNLPALDGRGKSLGTVGDIFEVITCYIRICPVDFGFTPAASTLPQVFKCIVVNWDTLVHFSAVRSEYDELPINLSPAYEDGLGKATGSLTENIEDIQQLASANVNAAIAARRRAISDRAVYNSSVIDPRDLTGDSPVDKIPMKPSAMAMGLTPSQAYYAIPFNDNISAVAMQEVGLIENIGYNISGQNRAKQGQFVKGNKSRAEFNTIMDFSTGRDRMCALHFETALFAPMKRALKYNIVANQGPETLLSRKTQKLLQVKPEQLQQAVMEFKIGDGLTPADKLADADTLQVALQTIQAVPQLGQEYPIGEIFATIMRAGGMELTEYRYSEEQRQYNQQLAAWQQAAAMAAEKGTAFSTPMPVAPGQQGQQ